MAPGLPELSYGVCFVLSRVFLRLLRHCSQWEILEDEGVK